jgi:hypothetical protein
LTGDQHSGVTLTRRRVALLGGAVVVVAVGIVVGNVLRGSSDGSGSPHTTGAVTPTATYTINMTAATGVTCGPPEAPGPAHPDPLLAQVFNVSDNTHTAYLIGWQIVPYHGAGTYTFPSTGDLVALQPPAGGRPLGYGSGTVTFADNGGASGTVQIRVKLTGGKTVGVSGRWSCTTAGT